MKKRKKKRKKRKKNFFSNLTRTIYKKQTKKKYANISRIFSGAVAASVGSVQF